MKRTILLDVNVWLALAFDTSTGHPKAMEWMTGAHEASFIFCRVTQSGFLRLATNTSAFPDDAVTMAEAWKLYDHIVAGGNAEFQQEPADLERHWRRLASRRSRSHRMWMDAYLAAFAIAGGHEIVTFDRGFEQYKLKQLTILA